VIFALVPICKKVDDARAIRRACGDALERALAPSVCKSSGSWREVGGGRVGVCTKLLPIVIFVRRVCTKLSFNRNMATLAKCTLSIRFLHLYSGERRPAARGVNLRGGGRRAYRGRIRGGAFGLFEGYGARKRIERIKRMDEKKKRGDSNSFTSTHTPCLFSFPFTFHHTNQLRRFYPSLENLCRVMLVHSGPQVCAFVFLSL